MGKILIANAVQRKSGHLYYVDGQGNVCEAVMARGKKKKEVKEKDETNEPQQAAEEDKEKPAKEWTNIWKWNYKN